jgi:hypothetical protein
MYRHPEFSRSLARQRERELIAAADRYRATRREGGHGRFATLLSRLTVRSGARRPAPRSEQPATEAS